jgi:hypothetical protein
VKELKIMEVTYLTISILALITSLFATYFDRNKRDMKIGEAIVMALFFSFIPLLHVVVIYYSSVSIKEYYEK